jgi:hypothetical protein
VTGDGLYLGGLLGVGIGTGTVITGSYATGNVAGDNYVGGLLGYAFGSNIMDSYATGNVAGDNYVGGLVGNGDNLGTITDSYATGNVAGDNYVGGLLGQGSGFGTITGSYATGAVIGRFAVGGFVGLLRDSSVGVNNSYASGSVTSNGGPSGSYIGGFAGVFLNESASNIYALGAVTGVSRVGGLAGGIVGSVTITEAYAAGAVDAPNGGGLIGEIQNSSTGTLSRLYWDVILTGQALAVGVLNGTAIEDTVVGLGTTQMLQEASFVDWDFTSTWSIIEGRSYPYFIVPFFPPLPNVPSTNLPNDYIFAIQSPNALSLGYTDEQYLNAEDGDFNINNMRLYRAYLIERSVLGRYQNSDAVTFN